MILPILLAAAALAAAEPAPATGATEVSPVTVPAPPPAKPEAGEKPKVICIDERPTGSRRIQRVCYDRNVYEETQERLRSTHVREGPSLSGGSIGGGPR